MQLRTRIALLGVGLVVCAAYGFRQADRSTPENTVNGFVKAIETADIKTAASFVKGGKTGADYSAFVTEIHKAAVKLTVNDLKVNAQGDQATASFTLSLTATGMPQPELQPSTLQLVREGGLWLIVPPATEPSGQTVIAQGLAYGFAHPEVFAKAKTAATASACLSNLKQICLGLIMFAGDNDEVLKLTAASFKAKLQPYVKNKAIFHCPDDPAKGDSYSLSPYMVGKSLTAVAAPAQTVMVYEGHNKVLAFRHGGKAGVGFADGHCKMIDKVQAKTLRWQP